MNIGSGADIDRSEMGHSSLHNWPVENVPRVSIGLPVYNGENYLQSALDSLLAQTYKDFELIISDNASTDETQAICETYADIDSRIRYIRNNTNIGAAANYNLVFELARGEYFKWAAHDDTCAPEFLDSCVSILDRDVSVVLCHPAEVAIDEHGTVMPDYMKKYAELKHTDSASVYKRFHALTCKRHGCYQVFGVVRSSALKRTQKIANYIGSDRVLIAELALMGRLVKTKERIYFRRHGEQYCALSDDAAKSSWFDPSSIKKSYSIERKNFVEYIRSIRRSALPPYVRFQCYLVMLDWLWKKRKRLYQSWGRNK